MTLSHRGADMAFIARVVEVEYESSILCLNTYCDIILRA